MRRKLERRREKYGLYSQVSIEPENEKDMLGKTFRDLQGYVQEKMNKSTQDADQTKNKLDKSDMENQSLREQLKRLESKLNKRDDKVKTEKNKVEKNLWQQLRLG